MARNLALADLLRLLAERTEGLDALGNGVMSRELIAQRGGMRDALHEILQRARGHEVLAPFDAQRTDALGIPRHDLQRADADTALAACSGVQIFTDQVIEVGSRQLVAVAQTAALFHDQNDMRSAQEHQLLIADEALRHEQVNYVGALHVLDAVLPHFLARRSGHISLVSSVAGYRGLPKSLAYGPTKAALINLGETLYVDLRDSGIGVSLVNPGFVETPLTAQNQFRMPALITPGQAAQEILAGWQRGRFEIHFPKRFTLWMKTLQLLPHRMYFAIIRRFTGL